MCSVYLSVSGLVRETGNQTISSSGFSVDCCAALFSGGNVYLEMKLDFFHFDSHKLGLYLKIPNFLTG